MLTRPHSPLHTPPLDDESLDPALDPALDDDAPLDASDPIVDASTPAHPRQHTSRRSPPDWLEHRFPVEAECDGWRLDRFLMKKMQRLSRNRIQRVIKGDLDVDGVPVARPAFTVHTGQVVAFRRPPPVEPEVPRHVGVAHEDPAFYVLEKPPGLPIHPTARYHHSTLTAVLRERFPGEELHVAHRLDRETSGLLVVGRGRAAAAQLKRAFARRLVEKRYLAIVHGRLEGERLVDAPLGLAGGLVRVKMGVVPVERGGLPSRTRVRALAHVELPSLGVVTLVEARPETGRQHQIRAHLDHLGHSIVGDKLYPDEALFMEWADAEKADEAAAVAARLPLPRHALHAAGIAFPHPRTGETVRVESPLPEDLRRFLDGGTPASSVTEPA